MFEYVRVRQWCYSSHLYPHTKTTGPVSRVTVHLAPSLASPSLPVFCLLLGPLQNDRDGWNPSVCMNFCAAFLSFAQNTVVQDDPR